MRVTHPEYQDFVRNTQDTLRVLADLTGGFAVVNQNDFVKSLKKIDAETSDYYVLGYYSNNPDPLKRRRTVEIRVNRPGTDLTYRREYTLKPPPKAITCGRPRSTACTRSRNADVSASRNAGSPRVPKISVIDVPSRRSISSSKSNCLIFTLSSS